MRLSRPDEGRAETSLAEAFEAEFAPLRRYLHRRVGSETADDLAVETFATAFANWHRFDHRRPLRPWLYGIAANLLRHHWRGEEAKLRAYAETGSDPILGDDEAAVAHRVDAQSRHRELAAALADLRPEDREILLLHAWQEFSDAEIASALSLPIGTVKSRLSRARERLRRSLDCPDQYAAVIVIDEQEKR